MPANTFLTTAAIGNREGLADIIEMISPTDTPLTSAIEKKKAEATFHEFLRDTMATPNPANARAEGADTTYAAITPAQRFGNHTQIIAKSYSISGTQDTVRKAGRSTERAWQKAKFGGEVKRDREAAMIENGSFTSGATRVMRGLRGWIATAANNSLGAGGAVPNISTNTAPTDGTLRTITEALFRTVAAGVYGSGGNVQMLLVHPIIKQAVSATFTGSATAGASIRYNEGKAKTLQQAWDVIVTDFGQMDVVPNRQMTRSREAYLVDPSVLALATLRPIEEEELAKIGDARNFEMRTECTLECREERALGCIRDIQA